MSSKQFDLKMSSIKNLLISAEEAYEIASKSEMSGNIDKSKDAYKLSKQFYEKIYSRTYSIKTFL